MSARRRRRGGRGRARRAARRRVGSAIIFALTILTPVLVASGTILSQLRAYSDEVDRRVNGVTAQLVAASGAHESLAQLTADVGFRGATELDLNGGHTDVDVTQIAGAETLDITDDIVQIRSEGWINGPGGGGGPRDGVRWFRSVVTATAKPRMVRFPIEQSCYIGDPNATLFVNGTLFRITGTDGAGDPGPGVPGIGITGDPAALLSQIPGPMQQFVTGGDEGSGASVLQTAAVDIQGWIERFVPTATIHWTSNLRLDDYTIGTEEYPAVAVADGNLNIRGAVTGYGALIIQGDLYVAGDLDFAGIILVGGSATFNGAMGNSIRHRGALLVDGSDVRRDLEIMGDVQLQYDSEALEDLVAEFAIGVEVVTWDHDLDAAAPTDVGADEGGASQ